MSHTKESHTDVWSEKVGEEESRVDSRVCCRLPRKYPDVAHASEGRYVKHIEAVSTVWRTPVK